MTVPYPIVPHDFANMFLPDLTRNVSVVTQFARKEVSVVVDYFKELEFGLNSSMTAPYPPRFCEHVPSRSISRNVSVVTQEPPGSNS